MNFLKLIEQKKRGAELSEESIRWLVDAYCNDEIPDYQMSALLMAVYYRGLESAELAVWASRMLHSGTVLDLSESGEIQLRRGGDAELVA